MAFTSTGNSYTSNFDMKKFIERLFIFLIPVIIFIALWEYGLSRMQNSYSLKYSQMEAQAPKIQVLVLGPSIALMGVDPDYFCMKGYNAANIAQPLFYDTRIALKFLDKMTSLKAVLITISYPSLWSELYGTPEGFRDYFYADYWHIRYPAIKWYDIHIYSKILQYGNEKAWRYALKGFNVHLTRGYCTNGWQIVTGREAPVNDSTGYAMICYHEKYFKQQYFYDNIQYLTTLLKALNNRNIHVVFFTPPSSAALRKYMDKARLKTIDSLLTVLCKTYHCEKFDFDADPRFSDKDFRDVSHLNVDGAIKFSKIINEEILKKYDTAAGE